MKKFEIWEEGYLATGMGGTPSRAHKIGEVSAETFQQACNTLCSPAWWQSKHGNYNPDRLTVWGCRLFDNETDARKSFG